MENKLLIKNAKDAINAEIIGIKKLSRIIDSNFTKILIKLSKIKGRVVFTGIGKSAHIAQKISSTRVQQAHLLSFFMQLKCHMVT
jgi:arabinose-5-phosphate isomerase